MLDALGNVANLVQLGGYLSQVSLALYYQTYAILASMQDLSSKKIAIMQLKINKTFAYMP